MDNKPFGALMLHGFPSNAGYFQLLDETLRGMGLITSVVKLKGLNAESPQALEGVTWHDWLVDAESALADLNARCERVAVIGYSMGGALAIKLAAGHGAGIDCLILLAAPAQLVSPFAPGRPFNFLVPLMARFLKKWDFPIDDTDFYRKNYLWSPSGAVISFLELCRQSRLHLPEIKIPVLILQSHNDLAVAPVSMDIIYNGLSTPPELKHKAWFEKTGHDMLHDCEQEAVISAITSYIQERIRLAVVEPAGDLAALQN